MAKFTVCLTHDVDRVHKTYQYFTHDVIRGKFSNLKYLFSSRDPYWSFERIVSLEDKYKVRSTFFFLDETIPLHPWPPKNWLLSLGRYRLEDPDVTRMIMQLDAGGWEIGLHGSYRSFNNLELLKTEKKRLEKILGKQIMGIRQHHLNLKIPDTWIHQKQAGFIYDASYGKRNDIGFLDDRQKAFIDPESGMFVIPLAIMDGYLFNKAKNYRQAWELTKDIINLAEQKQADLTILWHQRVFNASEYPGYADLYEKILVECKKREANFLTCREIYLSRDKSGEN